MKVVSLLTICLCTALWFTSCSDDNNDAPATPQFSIEEDDLRQDFEQGAAFRDIRVKTNLEASQWSVKSDQPWCLVSQERSSSSSVGILISLLENQEVDVRSANVTVSSSVKNYTIEVRQLGLGPAILLKRDAQTVTAEGGPLTITVTSNIEYTVTTSEDATWLHAATKTRALTDKDYAYTIDANPSYEDRSTIITYTGTKYTETTATYKVTQESKSARIEDIIVEGDFKETPTRGETNDNQSGYGIENSFDGKFGNQGNPYHSHWYVKALFPVKLEYFFDQKPDLDYLIYYSRYGNGNFGKVDIYTATESEPEYKLLGKYDFKMQGAPTRVPFGKTLSKVTKVKFEVQSGAGDFVSCDEMEFYRKNTEKSLDKQLLTVFTDLTCTKLKSEVTDEQMNALPGYFAKLAFMLRNNTYDEWEKEFRIQSYEAYSNVEEWAERLMTKKYSNLDNPTGIYVEPGDSVVILVGDTHGNSLSVQCIGEEQTGSGADAYVQTAASGETRFLQEGVNKVGFTQKGMLFIMYTADLTNPNSKPITIHIGPNSGKVSGFFDLKTHKTNDKYEELIGKATYKYFCVRGERIMFFFHRDRMIRAVPKDILSAIGLWDEIIQWEQELMGIDDVRPSQVNNHLFAISPEGSYMWASDYRIGFVYTYLDNILLRDNVMAKKDNAWGPAHEIGHIHQAAINWPSSTESSNNLFSNYVLYKLNRYCSRGSELSALATARCVNKQGWWNMGTSTHQNEDTELHMRMNWQLWNYYHRCKHKTDFFQTLFKRLREDRIDEKDPGAAQLKFAVKASQVANENLTEFFEMWGFFEPVNNETIEQYGNFKYNVTRQMITKAQNEMKQLPAPKHAFYYLEDRKNDDVGIENYKVGDVGYYTQFEGEGQKITQTVKYTISGQRVGIIDGKEAVAFELRQGSEKGKLLFFSNFLSFEVPSSIKLNNSGVKIYAVQADGTRIECKKK